MTVHCITVNRIKIYPKILVVYSIIKYKISSKKCHGLSHSQFEIGWVTLKYLEIRMGWNIKVSYIPVCLYIKNEFQMVDWIGDEIFCGQRILIGTSPLVVI